MFLFFSLLLVLVFFITCVNCNFIVVKNYVSCIHVFLCLIYVLNFVYSVQLYLETKKTVQLKDALLLLPCGDSARALRTHARDRGGWQEVSVDIICRNPYTTYKYYYELQL